MNPKYLRMIRGMKKGMSKEWSVYIVRCGGGTLYTGIAKDVESRIKKHNAGKGAAYVRTRLPAILLYQENGFTRSQALIREAKIKTMSRPLKEKLITTNGKSVRRKSASTKKPAH